eukprot:scaffold51172_cov36-Prasinocladus_malaysianus.AAC.1
MAASGQSAFTCRDDKAMNPGICNHQKYLAPGDELVYPAPVEEVSPKCGPEACVEPESPLPSLRIPQYVEN